MCGIVGIVGKEEVSGRLAEGLKRLEYRGYDSAGIATIKNKKIERLRAEGKIQNLTDKLADSKISGNIGIGHTRWATHGVPSECNAHPHATDKVAIVHNGIIENYKILKDELEGKGYKFLSQTDTEVIPHLITYYLDQGLNAEDAARKAILRLEGAYALGIIFSDNEDLMIAVRHGSPLAIGIGDGEMYLGSDALAISLFSQKIIFLEDGDIAILSSKSYEIFDIDGKKCNRKVTDASSAYIVSGKENYRHYMQKEIHEQPQVLADLIHSHYNQVTGQLYLPIDDGLLKDLSKITIVACGTSYYAGLVAKYWIEGIAKINVDIDIASEFRYREVPMEKGGVTICISQSGETADTLAALRYAKSKGQKVIALVNVMHSTMAREADATLYLQAGPEIGVASTKAFTAQMAILFMLVVKLSGSMNLCKALQEVPNKISDILHREKDLLKIAEYLKKAKSIIYIGRGTSYPIALEGALKLKELSYIHAEASASGELKHGPIALIDKDLPVVVVAPYDRLFDKIASNVEEVAARGGKIILLSDKKGVEKLKHITYMHFKLPDIEDSLSPLLYAIPVQLLAYHVAVLKGTDVDQPRNLAKSVTVE